MSEAAQATDEISVRLLHLADVYNGIPDKERLGSWLLVRRDRILYVIDELDPWSLIKWAESQVPAVVRLESLPPELGSLVKQLLAIFNNPLFRDDDDFPQQLFAPLCAETLKELRRLFDELQVPELAGL